MNQDQMAFILAAVKHFAERGDARNACEVAMLGQTILNAPSDEREWAYGEVQRLLQKVS